MFFKKCAFGSTSGMAKKAHPGLILLRKLLWTKHKNQVRKGTVGRQKVGRFWRWAHTWKKGKDLVCFSMLRLLAWWQAAVSAMLGAKTPIESMCP